MSKYFVEIEKIHFGEQLRNYGPHTWEAYLTFSSDQENPKYDRDKFGTREWEVKQIIPGLVHSFSDKTNADTAEEYFAPHLTKLEQVSAGRWHVIIEEPYID